MLPMQIHLLDLMWMLILIILRMNYYVMLLFLKIVTSWHCSRMPKINPRALETALGISKNVFADHKNVVYNVVVCLKVLAIIAIIVTMISSRDLLIMIISS